MSKILVLDGEPLETIVQASIWLEKAYQYKPYNVWYNERENCIEMEPTRDVDGDDSYTFYSFEDILNFVGGEDCRNFITEVENKEYRKNTQSATSK